MASILIVDDDVSNRTLLELLLEKAGHATRSAPNGHEALLAIETELPDLVLSDLRMPVIDGLELLQRVQERWPEVPVILISVEQDAPTIVRAVQRGAVNYLVKPCGLERIRDAVDKALRSRPGDRPPASADPPELLGRSPAMVEVRHCVALAARSNVNVLISGRTGTGKELVARSIHRLSNLSRGPLITHNCASCPPELVDSVLFGHRRGAFTGADRDHEGLVRQAEGGIFFLDELETMPVEQQAKLLRVLDMGEIRPVGSTQLEHVSVRFFAAVNEDPSALLQRGSLREDVYYRLRGFEIRLPTLKERMEDLPILVQHFLGDPPARFAPDAMEMLGAHDWPGNVRELENVIAGSRVRAGQGLVEARHLHLSAPWEAQAKSTDRGGRTLRDAERELICVTLKACNGNRSLAARALGIDRSTLLRRLARMGDQPP